MTAPKSQAVDEPTDPDVDLHVPAQRQQSWRAQGPIVAVVALGGATQPWSASSPTTSASREQLPHRPQWAIRPRELGAGRPSTRALRLSRGTPGRRSIEVSLQHSLK